MGILALKVLIIEDNPDDVSLVQRMLKNKSPDVFDLSVADRLAAGCDYLKQNPVDAVLLDLFLPDSQGIETLTSIQAVAPKTAMIILTGFDDHQIGVEAVNLGAQDCLVKGRIDSELLGRAIRHSVERARAAQSLLENERKFRSVIERMVDGIALIDEKGLIVEWNNAQEQISGIARADVMGRPLWDVQHQLAPPHRKTSAHYEALKRAITTFLETGQPPLLGREIQRPNGEQRTIQSSISPIQTSRGFMASIITRDVTEQQRAQQALEEAYLFSQHTLDALSTHIAVLDETGTIIAVNEAWRKFARANGLNDPNYCVGTSYLTVCDQVTGPEAEEARAVATAIREALANREDHFRLEYACHSPDQRHWFVAQVHGFDVTHARRVIVVHYDITQRKLAEEALAAERNLMRTLIDNVPDQIYAKDTQGRFILRNASGARHMGAASPEEAIGKTDFDFYPAELAARYSADDQAVIQSGQPLINREEPVTSADGVQGWISTSKVPLRDSAGNVIGLVGIGHDITSRKLSEERLEKLHVEINALYDISKHLGQTLNLETIYNTLHNGIAQRMRCDGMHISSYNPDDQTIRYVWAWADGQRVDTSPFPPIPLAEQGKGHQSHVIRTGNMLYIPDYQNRLNGLQTMYLVQNNGHVIEKDQVPQETRLPQSTLLLPLKLENRVLGVIQVFSYQPDAYSEDDRRFLKAIASQAAAAVANASLFEQTRREVAERERAEAALRDLNAILEDRIAERTAELRESERRYRAIVEDQTELICRSKPDHTITFVNDAYCHFYGTTREEKIGTSFEPNIFPEDRAMWQAKYASLTPASPMMTLEHRTIAEDGKVHWMQWTNRLIIDENGQPVEIQGVGRDISRQKQSEEVLRQALTHEMEINEMRSRFISMASHDLRTPLAVIQATMDLFSQYADRLSEERKRNGYQEVNRAIQQMVALLDDILIIGRADAGKLELEPEPLNVKAFCQNLLTEIKTALGTSHHLELVVNGQCEQLWMDSKLLRHIFSNLISNAIKYSPAGSAVEIKLDCTRTQVSLSVEDHGIGIPFEDQKHLFETFFRASNARNISGNGLGLAIVKQSVELHGGSITFESRPGEGTTFFVILPCIPLEEKAYEDGSRSR